MVGRPLGIALAVGEELTVGVSDGTSLGETLGCGLAEGATLGA